MEAAFYLYTILTMLICAATGTLALASYFVSRNKVHLYLMAFFMSYFFDLTLIFLYEYFSVNQAAAPSDIYIIEHPLVKTLLAGISLQALWLIVCETTDEHRRTMRMAPFFVFVAACAAITLYMPYGPWRQYIFYEMRQVFFIFMLGYAFVRYLSEHRETERLRLKHHAPLFFITLGLVACIIAEDTLTIMVWTPDGIQNGSLLFLYLSERNFSENILAFVFAFFSLRYSEQTLRLRYNEPPATATSDAHQRHIEDVLPAYCAHYGITQRECDVLTLILQGKDNQNIAGELQVAVGTVKAHTHNILKKTETATRQELIRDFWAK